MSGETGKVNSVQPGSGEVRNAPVRRSGIRIMGRLVGLETPLLPVMLLAILLGTLGYLCAIFLTILAGFGLLHILLPAVLCWLITALFVRRGWFKYEDMRLAE